MSKAVRAWDARPRYWDAWSEQERLIWREQQREEDHAAEAYAALKAAATPEQLRLIREYGEYLSNAAMDGQRLIVAHLQRYAPHLADLVAFAGPSGLEWHLAVND